MKQRSDEENKIIIDNLRDPYSLENFLSQDEVNELIDLYKNRDNKVHKNTGPVTSELKDDFETIPILKTVFEKIKNEVGDCVIYTGFFFYVQQPHIIHNDDDKLGPIVYKAFTLPLELEYNIRDEDHLYPYLCMFDQYYLDGPSKFFGGSKIDIPTFYNKQVYEYSRVMNKSSEPFDAFARQKYLTHLKPFWLEGLSFNSAHLWKPGNAIVFDCVRLHCASNFLDLGIKSKLGLSIFTALPQ